MKRCENSFPIPNELSGEDVYDILYIFDDEEEAINYVVKTYNSDIEKITEELYEEEGMRNEFGKKNYLRSATVNGRDTFISELMTGEYILWIGY